jgi:hypothetical protein
MNVQDLINKAVRLIGDYINITNYGTNSLDSVSQIVAELMRLEIGVKAKEYIAETGDAPYETSDAHYIPVALPADLTNDDQIISVTLYDAYKDVKTETHDGALYLLVNADYAGCITVIYTDAPPNFTAVNDVLPLSDAAVNTVASWGLAELFSLTNAPMYTDYMSAKYREAKNSWRKRDYNPKRVKAVYNY